MRGRQLLHFHEDLPDLALIVDRPSQPLKLLRTERHRHRFAPDAARPLIAWAARAGLVAFHQAAQRQPPTARQPLAQALLSHRQCFRQLGR